MKKRIPTWAGSPILIFLLICALAAIVILCSGCGGRKEENPQSSLTVISSYQVPKPILPEEKEPETEKKDEVELVGKTLKSNEEIAQEVMNGEWGQGQDRYDALTKAGYDADAIQEIVDSKLQIVNETLSYSETEEFDSYDEYVYNYSDGNVLNPYIGVVYFNGHKETYYSQRVLPGGGLDIPGRHVAGDGTIRDGEGYICVAADPSYLPYGSLVETSLGAAKVYDSGCDYGTVDIYTDWP